MLETDYEYEEIKEGYLDLQDNDYPTAYSIMVSASNLKETYDTRIAQASKKANALKALSEAVEARVCLEESKEMAIGRAEKSAKDNELTKKSKGDYFSAKEDVDSLQARASYLERIYYDCKAVWELGNRKYREAKQQ